MIIVFAVSRSLECALMQTFRDMSGQCAVERAKDILPSETSPRRVRHLLLDEGHEVELRVKPVGFRPGIREETLLIELLRYLWINKIVSSL